MCFEVFVLQITVARRTKTSQTLRAYLLKVSKVSEAETQTNRKLISISLIPF
jgi:hypothetical protein